MCIRDRYLDALLERVAKICPSAGNKGRELLSIAMKDAAGDKFINYNPMPETKPYPRAKPKVRVLGKEKSVSYTHLDVYKRQYYKRKI